MHGGILRKVSFWDKVISCEIGRQAALLELTATTAERSTKSTVGDSLSRSGEEDEGLGSSDRLARQLQFIREIDKLKTVQRRTWLLDGSRSENSAEHSWHLAIMVLLLREYAADADLDLCRAMRMALLHDLVEIDAGDTFVYDEVAAMGKSAREQAAADRLFALLPDDVAPEFRDLWEEFEARQSPVARFVAALDRLQPLMHNYHTQGKAWREHGVTVDKVLARNRHMADGAPKLWEFAEAMITDAVARGYLSSANE